MLLRKESRGVIAIPQIGHAWISGQLAQAWGNERFAVPRPREILCLAAEQHDIGWFDYDLTPDFDPQTGLPQEFLHLSEAAHTALWRDGVNRARVFGRFVALLVSLHADTLYSRHFNFDKADVETNALVRRFLDDQRAFQAEMLASLANDPIYEGLASKEAVEHHRLLIAALDALSLSLCWGVNKPMVVKGVPVNAGETADLALRPAAAGSGVIVEPWPCALPEVDVQVEGRRLNGPYEDEAVLSEAFETAEPAVVRIALRPA
jgi:hypothetical protein